MPKKPKPYHLTTLAEQNRVFDEFTSALQAGWLPLLTRHGDESDECQACIHWQVMRALAVALMFFANKVMDSDEELPAFVAEVQKAIRAQAEVRFAHEDDETVH